MNLLFNSEIVNLLLETFFVVWSALIVGGRWLHGAESPV